MCESLSGASRDRTQHYAPDGTTPITHLARYHLACLRSVFTIFDRLATNGYQGIIHSENPQAGFPKLPDVRRLAARPGWRLLQHADHCSNTCELDSTFPKKPSCYLTYNVDPHLTLAQCHNNCPHHLPQHPT